MIKNGIFAPRCQMLENSFCTAMGVKCFERRVFGGVEEGVCVGRSEAVRREPPSDPMSPDVGVPVFMGVDMGKPGGEQTVQAVVVPAFNGDVLPKHIDHAARLAMVERMNEVASQVDWDGLPEKLKCDYEGDNGCEGCSCEEHY